MFRTPNSKKLSGHVQDHTETLLDLKQCKTNVALAELFFGIDAKPNITLLDQLRARFSSNEEMIFLVETGALIVKSGSYLLSPGELLRCMSVKMSHFSVYCLLTRMSYHIRNPNKRVQTGLFAEKSSCQASHFRNDVEDPGTSLCEAVRAPSGTEFSDRPKEMTECSVHGSWWPKLHLNSDFFAELPAKKTRVNSNLFNFPLSLMKFHPKCQDWIDYGVCFDELEGPKYVAIGPGGMNFLEYLKSAPQITTEQWLSASNQSDDEQVYHSFFKGFKAGVEKPPDFTVRVMDGLNGTKKWKIGKNESDSCPEVISIFDNGDISHLVSSHHLLDEL